MKGVNTVLFHESKCDKVSVAGNYRGLKFFRIETERTPASQFERVIHGFERSDKFAQPHESGLRELALK